jgi:phosphatidylinositol phospholipase C, delta
VACGRDSAPNLTAPNASNTEPLELNESPGTRSRSRSRGSYPKSEPIVTHGWTFTSPCGFREVCVAIRESAFVINDLPIIVSLEVHADLEQQEVMVQIMKQEWKGLLVEEPLEGCDPKFRLPKLADLKNRILIKVKKAPARTEVPSSTSSLSPVYSVDEDASGSEDERSGKPSDAPAKKKVPICQSLSSLAIYTHSEHFKSFETPAAKKPSHIFSISESKILELHENKNMEVFSHNKTFFMRAFPNGMRVDSSNLDPSLFWRKGVQMVAMNWQNLDEGMMLNEGMFGDELGWVLKPPGYRSTDKGVTTQAEANTGRTLDLNITIFAGQHVYVPMADDEKESGSSRSGSSIRPVVKCELHVERPEERSGSQLEGGAKAREGDYKQKTKSVKSDHPDFGSRGMTMSFDGIPKVVEELSFVR